MQDLVVSALVDFATDSGDQAALDLRDWTVAHVDDGEESYSLSPLQDADVADLDQMKAVAARVVPQL